MYSGKNNPVHSVQNHVVKKGAWYVTGPLVKGGRLVATDELGAWNALSVRYVHLTKCVAHTHEAATQQVTSTPQLSLRHLFAQHLRRRASSTRADLPLPPGELPVVLSVLSEADTGEEALKLVRESLDINGPCRYGSGSGGKGRGADDPPAAPEASTVANKVPFLCRAGPSEDPNSSRPISDRNDDR